MNFISERCKIACDGQTRRSGSDQGDLFAVRFERSLRHQVFDFVFVIGGDTLQAADRDRLFVDAPAAACRFTRAITCPTEDPWEYVRVPVDHVRLGVFALGDQTYIL